MVFSVAAALLAGSFAFTYWVLFQDAKKSPRIANLRQALPKTSLPEKTPGIEASPPIAAPEPRLRSDAVMVRRIVYSKCGNQVVEELKK
jgi:hypothetical protein